MRLKAAVVNFLGSTCERDTQYVLEEILGIETRLISQEQTEIDRFQLIVLPGGFSYGDYLRPGTIASFSPIMSALRSYVERERGLVMGICNGFQILTEAGFLPGALLRNSRVKFLCAPVKLRVENPTTPFTCLFREGEELTCPIAHSDGRFYLPPRELEEVTQKGQVVLTYKANPNGSAGDVAGLVDGTGRVFGLMPHPERCSEAILGSTAGLKFFKSAVYWLANC